MWQTAELCEAQACGVFLLLWLMLYLTNQRSTLASINSLPDFNQHSFYVRKAIPIANLI